jgi:hypothetical protein
MKEFLRWSKKCNSMKDVADLLEVEEEEPYDAIDYGNQLLEKKGFYLELSERKVILHLLQKVPINSKQ